MNSALTPRLLKTLIMFVALHCNELGRAADSGSVRAAREALAVVDAQIAKERTKWADALGVINTLTNNKRTPVKEGSAAYYKCVEASKIVTAVEQAAPALKAQKEKLEALVKALETSEVTKGPPKPADNPTPSSTAPIPVAEQERPSEKFPSRIWTDSKGRQVKASFVSLEGNKVTVRTDAGQLHTFPLGDLSPDDQDFAKTPIKSSIGSAPAGTDNEAFQQAASKWHAADVDWNSRNLDFEKDKFYKLGPDAAKAIGAHIQCTVDKASVAYVLTSIKGQPFPAIQTMNMGRMPFVIGAGGDLLEFSAVAVYTGQLPLGQGTVPLFTCVYMQVNGKEVYQAKTRNQ